MKWFRNQGECRRENLYLLASGLLPEPESRALQGHLAECAGCRRNFEEMKAVAAPLAGWEKNFTGVELNPVVQQRWARAIEAVAVVPPVTAGRSLTMTVLLKAWFELIWPARRIWAGLAAMWVALAIFNCAQGGGRVTLNAQSSVPASEVRLTFQEQQRLLAEILGPPAAAAPTEPPQRSPQPRSEKPTGWRTATAGDEVASLNCLWA